MFLNKLKSNIIIMFLVVNLFIIDLGKINIQYNYTGLFVLFSRSHDSNAETYFSIFVSYSTSTISLIVHVLDIRV